MLVYTVTCLPPSKVTSEVLLIYTINYYLAPRYILKNSLPFPKYPIPCLSIASWDVLVNIIESTNDNINTTHYRDYLRREVRIFFVDSNKYGRDTDENLKKSIWQWISASDPE